MAEFNKILYVEKGSVDTYKLQYKLGDALVVEYAKGAELPKLVVLDTPLKISQRCIEQSSVTTAPTTTKRFEELTLDELYDIITSGVDVEKTYNFKAGDSMNITCKSGKVIGIQILGFNHDYITSKKKANISFRFKDLWGSDSGDGIYMNKECTNEGSWEKSYMRKYLETKVLPDLPDKLVKLIKPVQKKTADRNGNIITTVDKLFLLSEVEIFGKTTYSSKGEGKQYELFKDWHNRVMGYSDSTYGRYWWGRSPSYYGSGTFCLVGTHGAADSNSAHYCRGVAPSFAI